MPTSKMTVKNVARAKRKAQSRRPPKQPALDNVRNGEQQMATLPTASDSGDLQNLDKIEHVVVLMLENRSFDHMLGYLKLEHGRQDVDGLVAGMSNSYKGLSFPIKRLVETKLGKHQDPCHTGQCVAGQLKSGNGGFVKNYAETHVGDPDVSVVMGYYNQVALPTFDLLAEEYCLCNRWYASVPGATWPNRLYAIAGRAAGSKDNPTGIPKFNVPSFVRQLDKAGTSWKWYGFPLHPFGGMLTTLQIADDRYNAPSAGNYARFDPVFFQDAAAGRLPAVSWIDPDFGLPIPGIHENDDHPPADVVAGQELVMKVHHAVSQGPLWQKTLLVVVYDEHGGFYDHVSPTAADDDDPAFRQFGLRVPAFVVSPWVDRRSVSNVVFDHTSIIKTILLRFCRTPSGGIPDMGARVKSANHLGGLLRLTVPRGAPSFAQHKPAIDQIANARAEEVRTTFQMAGVRGKTPQELTEFQRGLLAASLRYAASRRISIDATQRKVPKKSVPRPSPRR